MRTAAFISLLLFIAFMAVVPRLRDRDRSRSAPAAVASGDLARWRIPLILAASACNGAVWALIAAAVCVFLEHLTDVAMVAGVVWAITTVLTALAIRTISLASPAGLNAD